MKDVVAHLIKPKMPYNPNVRKFSLVLSIKSKSAYTWVRQKFSKRLPTVRTLRSWQSNISANCSTQSGFNSQTLSTLEKLAQEKRTEGKELYISLCFDEISIRQHIQWVHSEKKYTGLINYAKRNTDEVPVANFAIFFLVTLAESGRSLILGYFLIKTLNTVEKAELIKRAIKELNNTGCYLMSISFDGLPTNFSACKMLGASFDTQNFHPFILNPDNSNKICIVLDPPHCIKLIRNCIAAKENLRDDNDNPICWSFFESLVSQKSNLISHKMTRSHVEFHSNKMNVRLAAQTLSLSVAKSMEVLLRNGDKSFSNAVGTIIFVKNFNKGFDIFNSKHTDSNNLFKRGLNEKNADKIFEFLDYFCKYIKSIKCGGVDILKSSRHTGFLGFLINTETLRYFYNEFVKTKKIENILFFFFGQDVLESLFGRIRSKLGSNTNPTSEQLMGVTRQLINFNEIKASEIANCRDELNILTVTSSSIKKNINPFECNSNYTRFDDEGEANLINNIQLNFKDSYSIKLRAGTIEKKIKYGIPRCTHEQCANIFRNNSDKIDGIFYENGTAQRPTHSTVRICEIIYKWFLIYNDIFNFDYHQFYKKNLDSIPFDDLYIDVDFSHNLEHKSQFILFIVDEYIRVHCTYNARIMTLQIRSKIIGKSAQKFKHFMGQ